MLTVRSLPTLLAVTLAGLLLSSVVSAQQQDQKEERDRRAELQEKRPKGRLQPRGFGGLDAAESQKAQRLFEEAVALEERGRLSAALSRYKAVYKKYPRSPVAAQSYYNTAEIFMRQNRPNRAFEAYDVIVRAYPDFGRFNELISKEYRIAYDYISGRRGRMLGVLPGFANRDRGIEYFERLIYAAPYSDFAPLALMNIANEYSRAGVPDAAVSVLDRLITNYPNSLVTSDGYLRLAQVHEEMVDGPLYDQNNTREAIESYEDYLILFPRGPNVGDAETGLVRMKEMLAQSRIRIADFYYFKRARYQAARILYNEAITIAPTSDSARQARERLAQIEVDEAKAEAEYAEKMAKGPSMVDKVLRRRPPPPPVRPITTPEPETPEPEPTVTPRP